MKINATDTAFPTSPGTWEPTAGLSKREYFAIRILEGYSANRSLTEANTEALVQAAIETADMLISKLNEIKIP